MNEQPTFSLAVVKGVTAGRTVRSPRKRISVGSAKDNDLVVLEAGIAPRHFLVLIDGSRWRVHTLTDKDSVVVDRRWAHPDNGKRGAIIRAAGAEILLYPGHLDQRTIDREVAARQVEDAAEMATSINLTPVDFGDDAPANEPTMAVEVRNPSVSVSAHAPLTSDPDLVEMAQMPTIAGERPPDALRAAAQQMLERRRGPVAPSVLRENDPDPRQTARDPSARGATGWQTRPSEDPPEAPSQRGQKRNPTRNKWDSSRRASTVLPPTDPDLPEVLAEPESQMMAVPGANSSVMAKRPDFATKDGDSSSAAAEVIPIQAKRPEPAPKAKSAWDTKNQGRRNAWGDGNSRALVPTQSDEERRNSWGDVGGSSGSSGAANKKKTKKRGGNAWGDGGGGRQSRPPASDPTPSVPPPGAGPATSAPPRQELPPRGTIANRIELGTLAGRSDAALEILNHPDGKYATQVRLLGAKIEEFAKNLGYRAYMVSSPEPLTGKTTAACNLAFALAEDTQRRVALVEANFRYPRFAEILGLDDRTGLISVLEGRNRLDEVGFKLSDRNLVILPAGGRHPAPAEVLASPRFKALIAELVDTVDIALIDAPSITPFADANLILPLVDAAFLVVTAEQTKRSWLGRSIGQIGESRVLGSMFNQLPASTRKALKKERKERLRK